MDCMRPTYAVRTSDFLNLLILHKIPILPSPILFSFLFRRPNFVISSPKFPPLYKATNNHDHKSHRNVVSRNEIRSKRRSRHLQWRIKLQTKSQRDLINHESTQRTSSIRQHDRDRSQQINRLCLDQDQEQGSTSVQSHRKKRIVRFGGYCDR